MKLTKAQSRELIRICDGELPNDIRGEKVRVALKNKGLAWREEFYPWRWHLTNDGFIAVTKLE